MMLETSEVLIVDDVAANRVALEALLRQPGVRTIAAGSGSEALEVVAARDIAVALIDVQMPAMDGFELADRLRSNERTREVPIIFVTASGEDADRIRRAYSVGGIDYLAKPLDPHVIRSKVTLFMQMHKQRRELQRRLAELDEALRVNEMFGAILGHDLRSPLASIMHSANLISRTVDAPAAVSAAVRIQRSGERMARLIEQLLDTARIRAGQFAVEPRATHLQRVADDIRNEFESQQGVGRVLIEAEGNCVGYWDGDRLAQLLSNLIGNAIKHGETGHPVRVLIDGSDDERVQIKVRNAGQISPAVLPYLFDPFRAGLSIERSAGLGLGLYISMEIVRAHGGEIQVMSNETEGTVFMVTLPRGLRRPDSTRLADGRADDSTDVDRLTLS